MIDLQIEASVHIAKGGFLMMGLQRFAFRIVISTALLLPLAAARIARAEDASCPLANEKPMLVTQLFFGLSVKGRGPVSPKEWKSFLARDVAPRFPDGFTVFDGYGQWLDPVSHAMVRENSKVLIIAVADTAEAHARLAEVSDLYRQAFHQQAVGMITSRGCGAF